MAQRAVVVTQVTPEQVATRRLVKGMKLMIQGQTDHKRKLREHERLMIDAPSTDDLSRTIKGYVLAGNARDRRHATYNARHTFLVYGFFRNKPYRKIEPTCKPGNAPNWARVTKMVEELIQDYHAYLPAQVVLQRLAEWIAASKPPEPPGEQPLIPRVRM